MKVIPSLLFSVLLSFILNSCSDHENYSDSKAEKRPFNGSYSGDYLDKVAFPIGGIGAGMICLEGTGSISHVSVRNKMDFFHEPYSFAALCIKGDKNVAKVLEGPVPDWKKFGMPRTGRGADRSSYGLPRFDNSEFLARFPFGTVSLADPEIPLQVKIVGWSPFIPGDEDNSSLPLGALEYHFKNESGKPVEAVFSYNTKNFIKTDDNTHFRSSQKDGIGKAKNGFKLWQKGTKEHPEREGAFAVYVNDNNVVVNHCWFRGGWWDPVTMTWKNIEEGRLPARAPINESSPGASLSLPFSLEPGKEKTIRLMFSWYVPHTDIKTGQDVKNTSNGACCVTKTYVPWYAGKFKNIEEVIDYWTGNYDELQQKSKVFSKTFYDTNLPAEVTEAVAG